MGVCKYGYNKARKNKPYYKSCGDDNKTTKVYNTWFNMMRRCYNPNCEDYELYKDCTVCKSWHNFQNFAEWWESNYYEIEGERMSLDKDIIKKDNKIYSPSTCCIVPDKLNTAFTSKSYGTIKKAYEKYKNYLPEHIDIAIRKRLWRMGGKEYRPNKEKI